MNPEERISKREYLNWIKGTLALMHLCDVVRNYAYHIFDKYLDTISDRSHYNCGSNFKYLADHAEWESGKWKYTSTYPCVCQNLFKEILRLHYFGGRSIGFTNCKDKRVGGPWGLAKNFMPVSKYCANIENPEDTDPATVFKMIQNCRLFDKIAHLNIDTIIDSRNEMMHSPTNNITDANLTTYIDAMIGFLQDALTSQINIDIQGQLNKALDEIRGVNLSEMRVEMLQENAERAIKFKKRLVIVCIKGDYAEGDMDRLGEYLDILEELGGDLLAWIKQRWDIDKMREIGSYKEKIEEVTKEREEAKKLLQDTREELAQVNTELHDTKNELQDAENSRNTIERKLEETQEKLDAITKEYKELQNELESTINKLHSAVEVNEKIKDELNKTKEELIAAIKEKEKLQDTLNDTKEVLKATIEENEKLQDEMNEIHCFCYFLAIVFLVFAIILVNLYAH